MQQTQTSNYKVVLVGDGGVGKTTWLKRLSTGSFEKKYIATLGVVIVPIKFYTNYGEISFDVWDTAGQEKFGGNRHGYYTGADAFVVMFDLTSRMTLKNAKKWYEEVQSVTVAKTPTVLVANKHDVTGANVKLNKVTLHCKLGIPFYPISAKSISNFVAPFLKIARFLTGKEDLVFVASP